MTPAEEIDALREALALERAKVHELSAALAAAVTARARSEHVDAERRARRSEQNRRTYEQRKGAIQRAESPAEQRTEPPSPPLEGSPLSSTPSLPSPISSPQPLSVPVAKAPEPKAKPRPTRSTAAEEFRDFAVAESRKHLPADAPDNCNLAAYAWPKLGKAMKEQGVAKMQAAYRLFLADPYWRANGLPLSGFVAKWEQFAGRVTAQAPPSGLLPKADDPEWVTV